MKKASKLLALAVAAFLATQIHAEGSYLGLGFGLQFDLGTLGETITKDGLDTTRYNGINGVSLSAGDLGVQKLIAPENTLLVAQHSGLITTRTNGPMNGGVLSAFWEKEGANTFWRLGVSYTHKIMGGDTTANFAGYQMIDYIWSYQSVIIPFYYGLKAGVGESASVYGGFGINFFRGGWGLEGNSDGQLAWEVGQINGVNLNLAPHFNHCLYLPQCGPTPITNNDVRGLNGAAPIIGEKIRFDVHGIGFNFLLGLEHKLQSGNKTYFEVEYIQAGGYDTSPARAPGSAISLNSTIAYPINLGGVRYNFGYKFAM